MCLVCMCLSWPTKGARRKPTESHSHLAPWRPFGDVSIRTLLMGSILSIESFSCLRDLPWLALVIAAMVNRLGWSAASCRLLQAKRVAKLDYGLRADVLRQGTVGRQSDHDPGGGGAAGTKNGNANAGGTRQTVTNSTGTDVDARYTAITP